MLAQQLAARLNLPNVLQTDLIHEVRHPHQFHIQMTTQGSITFSLQYAGFLCSSDVFTGEMVPPVLNSAQALDSATYHIAKQLLCSLASAFSVAHPHGSLHFVACWNKSA